MALKPVWEIQLSAGASPATIRVKNLKSTICGPQDAWGRPRREQPVSVSVEVSLEQPFGATSDGDALQSDTVHYGLLSKEILAILSRINSKDGENADQTFSLPDAMRRIWSVLTGTDLYTPTLDTKTESFLKGTKTRCLSVTVLLPKATLLGAGISYTATGRFDSSDAQTRLQMYGRTLRFHELRVPTLIGVNKNEREAKQMVSVSLEVDKCCDAEDQYCALERVIVQVTTDSEFQTLEALAEHLLVKVAQHLEAAWKPLDDDSGWGLKVTLEKPVAVPFADAVSVELSSTTAYLLPTL